MKVLLDEDVPHVLRNALVGHEVVTTRFAGWTGKTNGVLLDLAAGNGFNVVITCDRNIEHQQNVSTFDLAVIVLAVRDKRTPTVLALLPAILDALAAGPQQGTLTIVGTWRVS